jgi:hypothetical protein
VPRLLVSAIIVGIAVQSWGVANLVLRHEVNTEAPGRMIELIDALPLDAPVVVWYKGSRTVLGMGNALRSLRPAPTLLLNEQMDIPLAMKVLGAIAGVAPVVIAADLLDDTLTEDLSLEVAYRGAYPRQWADTLALIQENPTSGRLDSYVIYTISTP